VPPPPAWTLLVAVLAAREVARDERFEPSATAEATKSTCKSAACIVDASAPESRRRAPYHYARAKAWSYDVFVAHASEDKAVAREFVRAIEARGLSVWFDEEELLPGDSLRRRISAGLRDSTVGLVLLSHSFFAKDWPQWELDGLTARYIAGEARVLIPVWHGVTVDDVRDFSPPLTALVTVGSSCAASSRRRISAINAACAAFTRDLTLVVRTVCASFARVVSVVCRCSSLAADYESPALWTFGNGLSGSTN
jgi:hypothetical protein